MASTDARHWRQFTMRDLLITISIVAFTLVVVPLAPLFGVTAAGISLFAAFALPRAGHGRRGLILTLMLLAVLVPIEFGCGLLAYHTIGEIAGWQFRLLLLLNLAFLAAFALGSRRFAILCILVLAVGIVPYSVMLGVRWWLIHQDAVAIVDFAERTRIETGEFPVDLTAYEFRHPSIEGYIHYRHERQTFQVSYHIGTTSTSHWYDHGEQWQYYPD